MKEGTGGEAEREGADFMRLEEAVEHGECVCVVCMRTSLVDKAKKSMVGRRSALKRPQQQADEGPLKNNFSKEKKTQSIDTGTDTDTDTGTGSNTHTHTRICIYVHLERGPSQ